VVDEIREVIAASPIQATLCALQAWRGGTGRYACILALATDDPQATPDYFRAQLAVHEELVHVSVEVNRASAAMQAH